MPSILTILKENLLTEAGKEDFLRTRYVDGENLSEEVFQKLLKIDPTKGKFLEWIVKT